MIVDYNEHMLGVDKLDQMMSYYSFLHKTIKWWRKVFFWVLEVATVNAYILYKVLAQKRGERPMSHLAFRRKLILSLSEPIRSSVTPRACPDLLAAPRGFSLYHTSCKRVQRRGTVLCAGTGKGVVPDTYPCTCGVHAQTSLPYAQLAAFKPITHNY